MKNKFQIAITLAVILAMVFNSLALADQLVADADALVLNTPHGNGATATQNGGTTVAYNFSALIRDTSGGGPGGNDVFPGTLTVTITRSGAWFSGGTPGSFTFTAYETPQAGTIEISVPCGAVGTTETMSAGLVAGASSNGKTLNPNGVTLSYVITAGSDDSSCAPSNTAPEVTVDNDTVSFDEGDAATNTGTYFDADSDTVTLSASVGTVLDTGSGTWSWSFLTTDGPADSQTVTIYADDGQAQSSTTFDLTVNNVAPIADFSNDGPVDEGTAFNLSLMNPSDPSSVDTTAGFTYAFDCGAGYGAFGASNTASCPTIDNGTRSVGGKIQDKDGGVSEYTSSVTVNNANPVVAAPTWDSASVSCRKPATLTGISFSDAGVVDNPWHVNIDWGDSSTDIDYNTDDQGAQPNQSHTYNAPGTYTALVTVTDKDLGSGSNSSDLLTVNQTYTLDFLPPFDDSTPSSLIVNKMKYGRVVPVKVTIYDDCALSYLTDPSASVTIKVSKTSGTGTGDDIEQYADAGQSSGNTNAFRWTSDPAVVGGGFWIYNLDSKALSMIIGNLYRVDVYVSLVKATVNNWAVLQPVK